MLDYRPGRPAITALMFTALLAACGPDSIIDPSRLPDLPSPEAFDADFSFFERTPEPEGVTGIWEKASARIEAADTVMTRVLDVPFAALTDAVASPPMRSGSLWQWQLSFDEGTESFTGELRSGVSGNFHTWDLYLTAPDHDPVLTNYLMATGISSADGFTGTWNIAKADGTGEIEAAVWWTINADDRTNLEIAVSDSTSWSYERYTSANILTYNVYGQPRTRVQWDSTTGTGSTWSSIAGIVECWNEDLHDANCP